MKLIPRVWMFRDDRHAVEQNQFVPVAEVTGGSWAIVAFGSEADIFYPPLVPRLCLGTHCTYGSAVDAESKTRSKVNSSRSNCRTVVPKVPPLGESRLSLRERSATLDRLHKTFVSESTGLF